MDALTWKQTGMVHLQKYKYVLMVLLAGIFLMVLPSGGKPAQPEAEVREMVQPDLQESLADLLSRLDGAGKVRVLLTEAAGEKTMYQTNEDRTRSENSEDIRADTVLITNGSREEAGLVRQVIPATYRGAVVLCQGADNARVRLAVVNAVRSVTGLSSDKITVLKMK